MAELVERLKGRLSKSDREVAAAVMEEHSQRVRATAADADRIAKVKSFLKLLRERASVRGKVATGCCGGGARAGNLPRMAIGGAGEGPRRNASSHMPRHVDHPH